MLNELIERTYETKNRLLDIELDDSMDMGKEKILLHILRSFKGKKIKSLPKNVQEELKNFKNIIDSKKLNKIDFTSPYSQTLTHENNEKQNKKFHKQKNKKFSNM